MKRLVKISTWNETYEWDFFQFEMKDMGDTSFVLGIKIMREK